MSFTLARHQLALGIVPIDALQSFRAGPIDVAIDRLIDPSYRPTPWPAGSGRQTPDGFERLRRQPSGVHALLRAQRFSSPVPLRIFDESRRFAPRLLTVTVPPSGHAVIEPVFFPGAAYPIHKRTTGLRGRIVDATGDIIRWPRVEARRVAGAPGTGTRIGTAHGDDRGEFLLVLEPELVTIGALPATANVELTIVVAAAVPIPVMPDLRQRDRYWDLPEEIIPPGATPTNPVVIGVQRPPGYTVTRVINVNLELGFIRNQGDVVVP